MQLGHLVAVEQVNLMKWLASVLANSSPLMYPADTEKHWFGQM